MTPEALELARSRIEADLAAAVRGFGHAAAEKHAEFAAHGTGTSSMVIIAIHELAREEFESRALGALTTAQRILTADESGPSDESRNQILTLVRLSITELSSDIDAVYKKHCDRMKGDWPSLEEPREHALVIATSDLDIDFLARRRKEVPIRDALRAPRYEVCLGHWRKAQEFMEDGEADAVNALKEGVAAVEALAKVVSGSGATLGACLKTLRSQKLIDPGADKILEGLWIFANASPGVRHASSEAPTLGERDWQVYGPMIDGALAILLKIDSSAKGLGTPTEER